MSLKELETLVLAFRYLYYVEGISLINDYLYDKLESRACKLLEKTSQVHNVGSDLKDSYSEEVIEYAKKLETLTIVELIYLCYET